ncbi:MAG: sodium:proton antiporter [Acidobacteria bacterium]|nr:sodium:proton antiporter [Acidobacteriota bacterium]
MLLAVATFPLAVQHWWERNTNKLCISLLLGSPVLLYYLQRNPGSLWETGIEFTSFIILLASLYVVAGGILITGNLRATPQANTGFLAAGALLASFIGTTGASLLLIRSLVQTNRERLYKVHTLIFFIFLVSNIGGCLTPLGDPPLFIGYLEGVPFTWAFRLLPEWFTASATLLIVYFIWDTVMYSREPIAAVERDKLMVKPLRMAGTHNFLLLLAIIAAVAFLGSPVREAVMIFSAVLSLRLTPAELRRANKFTYYPIIEVAVIFFGIFLTMIPVLGILQARAVELGIREPWHFFWATGILSSFLDNTPTYLVFLNLARGLSLANEVAGVSDAVLRAVSLGAVFMGANTYIGNAPNFMIRSVAEENNIRMPSFVGYMFYSSMILIPMFVGLTVLFF